MEYKFDFKNIKPDLFDTEAESIARAIIRDSWNEKRGEDTNNSPTQLRKFYDEFCGWDNKIMANPSKFNDYLPLIRMLNAKAAYAEGRKKVSKEFVKFIEAIIRKIDDVQTFNNAKNLFEAVLGFHKRESKL